MPILNRLKNAIVPFLIALLVVLLAAFTGVMFFEYAQCLIGGLLGLSEKNEILKFLGIGMGGVLIAIQATLSYKRAKAMEDAANAQAGATAEQAKANENAEKGLRQERLKNAIEHIGHESDFVRLGGTYELFHLAEETEALRKTIFDILCAHIRRTTGESEYREEYKSKPSEEIQSLLALLFVQEHEIFKNFHINLQGNWLNGADLRGAHLEEANLVGAHLQRSNFRGADLQRARLQDAHLQGADLQHANLQEADLSDAKLQEVSLIRSQLQKALLRNARMHGAQLWRAQLQGANLEETQLQGANLIRTQLQGAYLGDAYLQGAYIRGVQLQGAYLGGAQLQGVTCKLAGSFHRFVRRIRRLVGRHSDLSGVIFYGGLNQEDVDSLVEGLSDEVAEGLRKKLAPHIDQPGSNELPENSEAVIGAYTKEEAEGWIAEYERAISKAPKLDGDN